MGVRRIEWENKTREPYVVYGIKCTLNNSNRYRYSTYVIA